MSSSLKSGSAPPAALFEWLEKHLDSAWLTERKQFDHPLRRALRAHHYPLENRAILESDDLPRALAFTNILRELSHFPTRRRNGIITTDQFFQDQLLNRAKQSIAEFDATELEATVAWTYAGILKQPIIALEPRDEPTPDFEMSIEGQQLYIECKARTTAPPLHQQIVEVRSEIGRRIWSLLDGARVNYGVSVTTTEPPKRAEIANLVKTLRPLCASNQAFFKIAGNFNVEGTILLPMNKEIVTPALEPLGPNDKHVPEPVRSFMIRNGINNPLTYAWVKHNCQMRMDSGKIYYRNPKVLIVHIAVTPDHVKSTARLIDDGRKQLPRTAPGIIAIRTPDFYGSNQFFRLGEAISHSLRRTSRVSGVVLYHQVIRREISDLMDWKQRLLWQLYVIRNGQAQHPLPPSFTSSHLPRGEGFDVLNRIEADVK